MFSRFHSPVSRRVSYTYLFQGSPPHTSSPSSKDQVVGDHQNISKREHHEACVQEGRAPLTLFI